MDIFLKFLIQIYLTLKGFDSEFGVQVKNTKNTHL